jgi:aspartyl-tRNA synthetase
MVRGWVQAIRNHKTMSFLVIRDCSGMVQATVDRQNRPDLDSAIASLSIESAVQVEGAVHRNDAVRLGQLEIIPDSIVIHGAADPQLPIQQTSKLDARLDWRFLDLRRPRNRIIFEVQTTAEAAMRTFWRTEGFLEIHSPKLMGSPSESGAELFTVDYFGGKAYLAQSPQFYKQMAMAAGLERVFEIGPVFRADPSFTTRHATEFTSIDMELSWIDSHEDVMRVEERWLQYVVQQVAEAHGPEIQRLFGTAVNIPELPFPRITMDEAQGVLSGLGHVRPPHSRDGDLDPQGEQVLGGYVADRYSHDFVFVTDYDWKVRPFYHMRDASRPSKTKSFDLLWKGLEVTTGAQREHRHATLVRQAQEKGLNLDQIRFYLDFFRFGCPPHGGLGFGLGRMLMSLLGLPNLREVSFLFRGPTRLTP